MNPSQGEIPLIGWILIALVLVGVIGPILYTFWKTRG